MKIILTALLAGSFVSSAALAQTISENEPNETQSGTAMNVDPYFGLTANPNITNSTTIPHVTILGTGDGTNDDFTFTAQAGTQGIFDVDGGNFLSALVLYGPDGTFRDFSYGSSGLDPGSTSTDDAYLSYAFTETGSYMIRIDNGTGVVPAGGSYTLHISAQAPAATPEPASWAMMVGGFGVLGGAMRARRRKALVPAVA